MHEVSVRFIVVYITHTTYMCHWIMLNNQQASLNFTWGDINYYGNVIDSIVVTITVCVCVCVSSLWDVCSSEGVRDLEKFGNLLLSQSFWWSLSGSTSYIVDCMHGWLKWMTVCMGGKLICPQKILKVYTYLYDWINIDHLIPPHTTSCMHIQTQPQVCTCT